MKINKEEFFEIVKAEQTVNADKLLQIAELAEKRAIAIKKIKNQALRITNEHDWVNQGGRPYLQASGAEKIARLFGISWRFIGEPEKKIEEDGHFRYEVAMEFVLENSSIEVLGSRSSRDLFFTTRYRDGKKITLPASEIDAGDVLKAAITNAIGNGITRILGIRNLTWNDLKEAGIDTGRISEVIYSQPSKDEKPEEKQIKKSEGKDFEFLKKMNEAKKALKELTQTDEHYYEVLYAYGYEHADQVKDKDKEAIYNEMKNKYRELAKNIGGK